MDAGSVIARVFVFIVISVLLRGIVFGLKLAFWLFKMLINSFFWLVRFPFRKRLTNPSTEGVEYIAAGSTAQIAYCCECGAGTAALTVYSDYNCCLRCGIMMQSIV